jgi:CRISPR-associated protein Cas1
MGWKIVNINKACKIKIKKDNLLLEYEEEDDKVIVLQDIDFILFDSNQFSITGKSLELISSSGIATLFVDRYFNPCSIMLPFHSHSIMTKIASSQINIPQSTKDTIWQNIVQSKVSNQSVVLKYFDIVEFDKLENIANKIEPFDNTKLEAQSARIYWKSIFENKTFRRNQDGDDILNSMLNYCYAILRSYMARTISVSGFLPIFGIWHDNRYNSFNLVDDLIEPFRPICDIYIKILHNKYKQKYKLDKDLKIEILKFFTFDVVSINNGNSNISKAIDIFVKNYKKAILKNEPFDIIYPKINISFFDNECF